MERLTEHLSFHAGLLEAVIRNRYDVLAHYAVSLKQAMGEAISPTQSVGGIMLQSPDGSVYRITVSNAGVLTSTAVPLGIR